MRPVTGTVVSICNRTSVADAIKWIASIIQLLGYAATAFGITPWNLYLFVVGVIERFVVGVLWGVKAIMLIHVVAVGAIITGMTTA